MNAKESRSRQHYQYSGAPRRSFDSAQQYVDDGASIAESVITPLPEPKLPDLNLSSLDLAMSLESILSTTVAAEPDADRVQKRASNVMKLAQENEKLKEELRAMNERLEAAERKQAELRRMEAQAAAAAQRSTKGAGKT